tara:strand:- start:10637 stop:10867 length:231 start_codon:yes stop_codon:yes gene_type:complete
MIRYEDKCDVTCNDNDNTVLAEVMQFKNEDRLIVAVAGNKIQLDYNGKGMYVGNKIGMEFISKGPKTYEVNMGRQR